MNPQQLSAFFAAHKPVILGGGAVLVAALGLRARKKSGGAKTTAGATIPGTIPAAAVVGGTGSSAAAYDSTAFDVYDALNQRISDVASQLQTGSTSSGAASATPAPVASTLFAPTYDGNYAMTADGQGVEIESDGSLYHINNTAAQQIAASGGKYSQLVDSPGWYSLTGNLQAKQAGGAPQLQHYDKSGALVPYAPAGASKSLLP